MNGLEREFVGLGPQMGWGSHLCQGFYCKPAGETPRVAFIASTLLFLAASDNSWPLYLSVPVLLFVGAYSYTKRFTALAHFWLGASLLLAPVAA